MSDPALQPLVHPAGESFQPLPGEVPLQTAIGERKSPLWWIPTASLSMGIAYIMLTSVTAIMFKNLGMDNGRAAEYASYFILAYTIKPLFSPIVEMYKTKKFFVLVAQVGIGIGFGAAALAMALPNYIPLLIAIFFAVSFLGSTQDIASDGVYITALDRRTQSLFIGVQSLSWNCAPVIASGGLVYLSGQLHSDVFGHASNAPGPDWIEPWRIVFGLVAIVCLMFPLWHLRVMPDGARAADTPGDLGGVFRIIGDVFVTFFQKPRIAPAIVFVLLFQLGVGLLEKPGPFFMIDTAAVGGLGLDNKLLGLIYGVYGLAAMLVGSLLGGVIVSRFGVRRTLLIACLAVNVPNVTFLLMALDQPSSLPLIALGVMTEKLFYGFGIVVFVVYMMQQVAPGKYATAHLAFATGIKGLCMMLTGMVSGHLQQAMGYPAFFALVMTATIPCVLAGWFAPFPHPEQPRAA